MFLEHERLKDRRSERDFFQENRLQLRPERRLNRGDKFRLRLDLRGERTQNRGFVWPFQHGLCARAEPRAFLVELTQDAETRIVFRHAALGGGELFFHLSEIGLGGFEAFLEFALGLASLGESSLSGL